MDEIYTKIQVFLLKKDKECEKLRFLTSRTTPSNAAHVSDVCETITSILQDPTMSTTDKNSIQHFKFLLLNTNFKSQEYLCEDIANGHLVDMCPPLSPYLFIQILLSLNYDHIICTSVLYIPIDLSCEILDALRRCLDVEFQRAFTLGLGVIANCYKKIVSTNRQDIQILEEEESLKRLMGSVQELISLLAELPDKKVEGISQLGKYERSGWVLIELLNSMRDCMATRRANDPSIFDEESEKLYKVTFGRDHIARIDPELVAETLDLFSKELLDLLLANVKKIDCYVYMGWAEIDYAEDTSMTMQRAVGLACYHFVEFLGAHEPPDESNSHVVECLKQLSSEPDAPFSMSLKELRDEVAKGNKECLRKLIARFEEWDSPEISCLDQNRSLIEKGECLSLLDGVSKFSGIPSEGDDLRAEIYATAMKILLGQRLVDMVEIVVEFILIHDASRKLESTTFKEDLKSHFNQGVALCSSKTSLRIIYFFVIQNPREVLKALMRAAIGYREYANSLISAEDFCKLSPVVKIRDSNNISMFSNALREICNENIPWNGRKFNDFLRVLLDKNVISADEILNDVFIPVLKNHIIMANIQPILNCVRNLRGSITPKMNKRELLYVLSLQMTFLRENPDLSINSREEALDLLIRVVQFFSDKRMSFPVNKREDSFTEKLEASLEPLDKIYFAPQWGWIENEISLDQVLQDYKKRCVYVIKNSKSVKNCSTDFEEFLEAHGLETSDFLHHLILRCTEFEYFKFAKEALLIHWNYFGWRDELDAYAQFSLATIKACGNNLGSFDSIQKFASLIKSLAKLTMWFINIDVMEDYESVHKSLVIAMNALNLSENIFPDLFPLYQKFKVGLSRSIRTVHISYEMVAELVHDVEKFGEQCLPQCSQPVAVIDRKTSRSALQFYLNSTFVSICSNWPMDENRLLLSKIDKKLYSKREDAVQRIAIH